MSLLEFTRQYATAEDCLAKLESIRWKDGAYCPHCASSRKIYHYSDGRRHRCADCNRVFRVTTGTVFSESPLKLLPKWFAAIYLVTEHSKGISSVQLAKRHRCSTKDRLAYDSANPTYRWTAWAGQDAVWPCGDRQHLYRWEGAEQTRQQAHPGNSGPWFRQDEGGSLRAVAFGMKEREGAVKAFQVPAPTMPPCHPARH